MVVRPASAAFRVVLRPPERIAQGDIGLLEGLQVGRRVVSTRPGAVPRVRAGAIGRCARVRVHLAQPAPIRPSDLGGIRAWCHTQERVQVNPGAPTAIAHSTPPTGTPARSSTTRPYPPNSSPWTRTTIPATGSEFERGRLVRLPRGASDDECAGLLRVIENATGDTWRNARRKLDRMHLVTLATNAGQVAQRTTTTPGQQTLLRALDLPEPPGSSTSPSPAAAEPPLTTKPCSNTTPAGPFGVPAGQPADSDSRVLMIFGSPVRGTTPDDSI
jgi:hypothetical protein